MSRAHRMDVNHRSIARTVLLGLVAAAVIGVSPLATGASAQAATKPAAACQPSGGAKIVQAAAPAGDIKVFGHGFGHGMGMSQYGAQGAARLGCSYATIVSTYYAGTALKTQPLAAPVLLTLARQASSSTLTAVSGAVTWTGFSTAPVVQPKGSTWTVTLTSDDGTAGAALLDGASHQKLFVRKGVPLTAAHSGTVVTIDPSSAAPLTTRYDQARFVRTADKLGVTDVITGSGTRTAAQKYLAGLAEVPVTWPIEALKAQAVAARTFLSSKYSPALKAYTLGITTMDQVYRGYSRESEDARYGTRWQQAVDATTGQIIVDQAGKTIEAMYSSSMGGYTENRQYVYGSYGISYLKAVDDSRWDAASDNPYRSWSTGFSKAAFASRFGFDSITTYSIGNRGSESRIDDGVTITGTIAGKTVTKDFTGSAAKTRLGLRSTGFTFA